MSPPQDIGDQALLGSAQSAPSYSLIWEETDGSEQQGLGFGSNIAAGIAFFTGQDMIGEVPKKVTCYLKKSSTPTGIATLKLISSLNSVKTIFGTIDVSTLTTSFAEHSFINDSATASVTDGDILAWFYSGTTDFRFEMAATATAAYTQQKYSSDAINWSSYDVGQYPSTIKIYG